MSVTFLAYGAVFAPLFGFLLGALSIRLKGDRLSQGGTCLLMLFSLWCVLSLIDPIIIHKMPRNLVLIPWMDVGTFHVDWGLQLDTLSIVMMSIVTLVSLVVHIYSIGYMSHDSSIPRFMAYLSLFTFMMLMLVTAPNLIQMFFGWEGVGLASYLLIGFWHEKESANAASMKAFLVNRVGDVGLALGIFTLFSLFHTVTFHEIFAQLAFAQRPLFSFLGQSVDALNLIGILLFIGAMGKSAQFGLHTWLPDAMEGPTPVSALIHAATMVTAGVFMIARLSPLYEMAPLARDIVVLVGAFTAFFAATVALTQTDIKRVIAYSTCSQLGYMFFAAGCSAYNAAIFHLVTHAFFKALLFLGAGSVIHAMSDEQDMRCMGGLYRLIPKTYAFMWIGSLALAGIPFFAGYYSKDAILESTFLSGSFIAFSVGLLVAFLTAFYSWRLLLLTFHGTPHADEKVMAHVHESPHTMLVPLAILSLGALLSGYLMHNLFLGESFWNGSIFVAAPHHEIPTWVMIAPLVCAVLGILLAYLLYEKKPALLDRITQSFQKIYQIFYHKWYVDELYDRLFIRSAFCLGNFFSFQGDQRLIDRFGPNGVAEFSQWFSKKISRLQTGYVYHYAFATLIGIVVIMTWYLFSFSHWIAAVFKG